MTTFKSRNFLSPNLCEVGKTFAQRGKRFGKLSKPAKSTVFKFLAEASVNSMSTKSTKAQFFPIKYTLSYVVPWQIGVTRT